MGDQQTNQRQGETRVPGVSDPTIATGEIIAVVRRENNNNVPSNSTPPNSNTHVVIPHAINLPYDRVPTDVELEFATCQDILGQINHQSSVVVVPFNEVSMEPTFFEF